MINKTKQFNKNRGFTLIELLLVIAIIAIIAGAVLVAMNPARRINESNDARRWTDIRSVSDAIGTYITDNGGAIPHCDRGEPNDMELPTDGIYRCIGTGGGSGYNYAIDDPNLVSWWNFEEVDDVARSDLKPSDNDLLDVNSNVLQSDNHVEDDHAADFEGANQYLSRSNFDLSSGFPGKDTTSNYSMTVSAWIRLDGNIAFDDEVGIAAKKGTLVNDEGWALIVGSWLSGQRRNKLSVVFGDGASEDGYIADTSLTFGSWHHVAFTYEYGAITRRLNIYLDGSKDIDEIINPGTLPSSNSGDFFTVGRYNDYFDGLIDELAVFDYALTEDQIQEIYFYGLDGSRLCCDLSSDLATYLHKLPEDPQEGSQNNTGYVIRRDPMGSMWIRAPYQSDETVGKIEVSR